MSFPKLLVIKLKTAIVLLFWVSVHLLLLINGFWHRCWQVWPFLGRKGQKESLMTYFYMVPDKGRAHWQTLAFSVHTWLCQETCW